MLSIQYQHYIKKDTEPVSKDIFNVCVLLSGVVGKEVSKEMG